MKKVIWVVLVFLITCLNRTVLANDFVTYKSNWNGMTTQGYHEISDSHMKQELFYDSSIKVQSEMLEKMFIFCMESRGRHILKIL